MIIVDRNDRKYQIENVDQMTYKKSLIIGFCQCLAMIPGVSRSGSTIISAMLCKVNRNTACEFSFFLAIPTILSACCYDVIKNFSNLNFAELELILIGTFSSFISAILVINWFIKYVSKHNFFGFGVYRIIIGIMIMIFLT
jgi:undecaprenyl-diphosphatase